MHSQSSNEVIFVKNIRSYTLNIAAMTICLASPSIFAAKAFDNNQTQEIQKIVHDYLVSNPDVLIEASNALREKEQQKAKTVAQSAITKLTKNIFQSSTSPTFGNNNGETTIVEFIDYQCGHCKNMSAIVKEIARDNKKVKIIVKELPIFGKTSNFAARAAVASFKQGADKYLALHDELLKESNPLDDEKVLSLAKKAGLNVEKLKTDMESESVQNEIRDNFTLAQEIGLLGTPAFIVGNKNGSKSEYIPGATSKEALLAAVKKVSG